MSNVGAVGVMQLMPGTCLLAGARPSPLLGHEGRVVIEDNIEGWCALPRLAPAEHRLNGHGRSPPTTRGFLVGAGLRGMIPETRRYVANVLALVGRV